MAQARYFIPVVNKLLQQSSVTCEQNQVIYLMIFRPMSISIHYYVQSETTKYCIAYLDIMSNKGWETGLEIKSEV